MKKCAGCGQEVSDLVTACDHCGQPVGAAAVPKSADDPRVAGSTPESLTSQAGLSRRQAAAIVFAVMGSATITLALLMAAGSSSSGSPDPPAPTRGRGDAASPSATPLPSGGTQKWTANPDWVGHARNTSAFELRAERQVQIWGRYAHPILVVRCYSGQMDAFVFIESAAKIEPEDERHTVRVAFDSDPESIERWADSEEHDALIAPNGSAFVRRLAAARVLRFGYTPHNATRVAADFHVAGLGEHLARVAGQCGLKK